MNCCNHRDVSPAIMDTDFDFQQSSGCGTLLSCGKDHSEIMILGAEQNPLPSWQQSSNRLPNHPQNVEMNPRRNFMKLRPQALGHPTLGSRIAHKLQHRKRLVPLCWAESRLQPPAHTPCPWTVAARVVKLLSLAMYSYG